MIMRSVIIEGQNVLAIAEGHGQIGYQTNIEASLDSSSMISIESSEGFKKHLNDIFQLGSQNDDPNAILEKKATVEVELENRIAEENFDEIHTDECAESKNVQHCK